MIGYARVSTEDQAPLPQSKALQSAGCVEIFEEHASGGNRARPVLAGTGGRNTDDRLPAIIAAIKGADPNITLHAICDRLESMRERTPRGRTRWQPSSVKMLLERAKRLGLL